MNDSEQKPTVVPTLFRGLGVLVVDQDTSSLLRVASILEQHSYKVTTTEVATIALAMLGEHAQLFDLVMADIDMPEMDIIQFLKSIKQIKDLPIILMYSRKIEMALVEEAMANGACFFFEKPVSIEQIKNVWQHVCRTRVAKKMEAEPESELEPTDNREKTEYKHNSLNNQDDFSKSFNTARSKSIKIDDSNVGKRSHIRMDSQHINYRDLSGGTTTLKHSTADVQGKFTQTNTGLGLEELPPNNTKEMTNSVHFTLAQVANQLKKDQIRSQSKLNPTFSTGYGETTFSQLPTGNNLMEFPQGPQIQDFSPPMTNPRLNLDRSFYNFETPNDQFYLSANLAQSKGATIDEKYPLHYASKGEILGNQAPNANVPQNPNDFKLDPNVQGEEEMGESSSLSDWNLDRISEWLE